jgi:hypothetical protein
MTGLKRRDSQVPILMTTQSAYANNYNGRQLVTVYGYWAFRKTDMLLQQCPYSWSATSDCEAQRFGFFAGFFVVFRSTVFLADGQMM